jgi:hypothetical protein
MLLDWIPMPSEQDFGSGHYAGFATGLTGQVMRLRGSCRGIQSA